MPRRNLDGYFGVGESLPLTVRLTPDDRRRLQRLAERAGMTPSEVIRRALRAAVSVPAECWHYKSALLAVARITEAQSKPRGQIGPFARDLHDLVERALKHGPDVAADVEAASLVDLDGGRD